MQIYNNPFEQKGNKNNVRNNQILMRGLKTLAKSNTSQTAKPIVSSFVKGQVIKGLVLDVSNKQVVLQMENGEKLNATIKDAAPLNIGEELYFEVKDESQNQVQLRPLTDPNVNPQNATLEKVLNSHGLMMNEKNLSIVSELMEQGMNLDDATIRTIIRNSAKFPESSIKTLVLMEKLQLPVNETSLSQLSEYEEGNGMILKQTEDFIHQFCDDLQFLKEKEGFETVSQKLSQMIKNEDAEVTKEFEILQKIEQVIKEESDIKDSTMVKNETTDIKDGTMFTNEEQKAENKDIRSNDGRLFHSGKDIIQNEEPVVTERESDISKKDFFVQEDLLSGQTVNMEEIPEAITEPKAMKMLEKINQIIQEEYPEEVKDAKGESVIQKDRKDSQEQTLLDKQSKVTPETKETQVLRKISQLFQKEYPDTVKNAKGDSSIQNGVKMNQPESSSLPLEVKGIQIIQRIHQILKEEYPFGITESTEESQQDVLAYVEGNGEGEILKELGISEEHTKKEPFEQKNIEQKIFEQRPSQFFKEFDTDKLLANNSSKTVEYIFSQHSSFKEVLSSFLELSENPLLKGTLSPNEIQQITDCYVQALPKEEMIAKIEQILIHSESHVTDESENVLQTAEVATLPEQIRQEAQNIVEFMDHMELSKDLPQKEAQKTSLNPGLSPDRSGNQSQSQNQNFNPDTKVITMKLESELSLLRDFLKSRDFNGIVKGALQESWYAEPEDLKDDFKVKEQLRKIGTDLNRISELFEKEGGFTKTAELSNQIKDNIDFMNQINQYYQYVQIPLKLTKQLTNSELYVYTNKKNLKNQDGQISVLLHLDMKHLGSTDIHVSLMNQSIHTRFYLEEEESLEILEHHVNELEAAIQKLGYAMSYEMNVREKMPSFVENLLEEKPKTDIKRYNFDVRM